MRAAKSGVLTLLMMLGAMPCAMAQYAALPFPNAATPKPIDLGETKSLSGGAAPMSVTIALALPNIGEAETLLKSLNTPGDPQFHKYLSADQFAARFAPTNADVAKVIASLAKYGLTAERTSATTLKATGLPANVERAFGVTLHSYEVLGHGNVTAYRYHAPLSRATIPAEISPSVAAVAGLDSRPSFRPRLTAAPRAAVKPPLKAPSTTSGNPFGELTVSDFAKSYDVQPLYSRGVSGSGRTLGIMTFASFTPSDAYTYWSAVGLNVRKDRIKIVNVDGGPGAPSDDSGSDETTLDVEQSGGIAPGAKIIVYQGPNTNQAFLDVFAAAIDSDQAESLSISWGSWEWFDNLENSPVTEPSGRTVGLTQAVHQLLVRAAIQGQSVFAAAGDGGAYDANDSLGCYGPYSPKVPTSCSLVVSVDYPASDTAITAGGGTTLPGLQSYCLNSACTPPYYDVYIARERVWGWDYLDGLCEALGYGSDTVGCGIFGVGGGGGVSVLFPKPDYQYGIDGVQLSQPHQVYIAGEYYLENYGVGIFYKLPSHYAGRNVPDISFNADPDTGYSIYYTSDVSGFEVETFIGGTSFVAPQLNGVTALLGQYLHAGPGIGLLNYALYGVAAGGHGYKGHNAPFHAIAYGDNWFYHGSNGYNPGAGLGTLDVFNFAQALRDE